MHEEIPRNETTTHDKKQAPKHAQVNVGAADAITISNSFRALANSLKSLYHGAISDRYGVPPVWSQTEYLKSLAQVRPGGIGCSLFFANRVREVSHGRPTASRIPASAPRPDRLGQGSPRQGRRAPASVSLTQTAASWYLPKSSSG